MYPVVRSTLITAAAAIGAASLTLTALATPASAHEAPKPGRTCAMSGMTYIEDGRVQVCVAAPASAKPRWSAATSTSRSTLTMSDAWVKAADTGMTAVFGMIKNPTSRPVRVIGAATSLSTVAQLHEVVDKDGAMVMQQKSGGFVIPAGGTLELKPGGNHIMIMDLAKPIKAGRTYPVTLITSDGGLLTFTALGKVYSGANESYNGSSPMSGM